MTQPPPRREITVADLTKDQQAEIRSGVAMQELIAFAQWKLYQKVLESILEANRTSLEAPIDRSLDGMAQALRFENLKGTINGLRLALAIPSSMINASNDLRKQLLGSGDG